MNNSEFELMRKAIKTNKLVSKLLKFPVLTEYLFRYILGPRVIEEETEQNKDIRFGLSRLGSGLATAEELTAMRWFIIATYEMMENLLKAHQNGEPIVCYDWSVPSEIIRAFHVETTSPVHFNRLSFNRNTDYAIDMIDKAEFEGMDYDMCNLNRVALGAILNKQMPPPTLYVSASHPCDSSRTSNQILHYLSDVEHYVLEAPYDRDREDLDFYAKNLWDMIAFLEKHYNRSMDWDKLRKSVDNINTFNRYLREVTVLHRAKPSPNLALFLQNTFSLHMSIPETDYAINMARQLLEIAKKRVANPSKKLKNTEKVRVICWDPVPPAYDYYKWIEKHFGAIVVIDYEGSNFIPDIDTSSRESMIRGIGEYRLMTGMIRQTHGDARFITEELSQYIEEYSADCVIMSNTTGCKGNMAAKKLVINVCNTHGVPALFLDMDIYDKRINSEAETKNKIRDFFISNGWGR